MNRLFLILILLSSVGLELQAATRITATVTVTNAPTTNGSSFTYNGDVRTGTNELTATTWATNTTIGGVATNLFQHLIFAPPGGPVRISMNGTNAVNIVAPIDGAVSISFVGDWASVSYSTQTLAGAMRPISVPASNYLNQATATNDISQLANDYNAYATNWFKYLSNGVNYGDAFSSPGSVTGAEQFGTLAAATGTNSTAIGKQSVASALAATSSGTEAIASDEYTTAIGAVSIANAPYASAFGASSVAGFTNSTAVGAFAQTTEANQVMLGSSESNINVHVSGKITVGGYVISPSSPFTNNTSQAAGDNSGVLIGEHENVWLSGMGASAFSTAGIVAGRDGRTVTLWNTNGASWTILDNSGLETTPENRIRTGTSGTVTITNNPGFATFIYNTNVARWWLKSRSN